MDITFLLIHFFSFILQLFSSKRGIRPPPPFMGDSAMMNGAFPPPPMPGKGMPFPPPGMGGMPKGMPKGMMPPPFMGDSAMMNGAFPPPMPMRRINSEYGLGNLPNHDAR